MQYESVPDPFCVRYVHYSLRFYIAYFLFFFFFLKVFGGHMSFFGATGTPVLDFW